MVCVQSLTLIVINRLKQTGNLQHFSHSLRISSCFWTRPNIFGAFSNSANSFTPPGSSCYHASFTVLYPVRVKMARITIGRPKASTFWCADLFVTPLSG